MSRLVARILLSMFMFPLAGIVYLFLAVVGMNVVGRAYGYQRHTETTVFAVCGAVTWVLVAIYWCLLWRSSVKWSPQRIALTWAAAFGALAVGGGVGLFASTIMPGRDTSFGTFIAGVLAIILWVIGTVFVWRETAAERAHRISRSASFAISCPTCGYNLTGLSESRCPECGSKFTLDELAAAQPNTRVEIE